MCVMNYFLLTANHFTVINVVNQAIERSIFKINPKLKKSEVSRNRETYHFHIIDEEERNNSNVIIFRVMTVSPLIVLI